MYTPWTSRTIGIEMEMNPITTARTSYTLADLHRAIVATVQPIAPRREIRNCGGHAYSTGGRSWDIKTDSSAGVGGGYEVASPALALDAEGDNAELKAACAAINALSPQVDRHCGLHVTIDCRDFTWQDIQKLLALWTRYEPFFFEMVPANRKHENGNQYCAGLRKESWTSGNTHHWPTVQAALAARTQTEFDRCGRGYSANGRTFHKYSSLNVSKWWNGGLVEFRLHSGTVNYVKIRNFAKVLLAVVNRVKMTSMPRIQTAVNVSPAIDSSRVDGRIHTLFIAKLLGLAVSAGVTEVPASNAALMVWMDSRRAKFAAVRRRTRAGSSRGAAVVAAPSPEADRQRFVNAAFDNYAANRF